MLPISYILFFVVADEGFNGAALQPASKQDLKDVGLKTGVILMIQALTLKENAFEQTAVQTLSPVPATVTFNSEVSHYICLNILHCTFHFYFKIPFVYRLSRANCTFRKENLPNFRSV